MCGAGLEGRFGGGLEVGMQLELGVEVVVGMEMQVGMAFNFISLLPKIA